MITERTARALRIIMEHLEAHECGIWPAQFAAQMWPDSPGHKRSHKCGPYGASRGVMMAMAAGGYLGKLRKRGLTGLEFGRHGQGFHYLTGQGRAALAEWENDHEDDSRTG